MKSDTIKELWSIKGKKGGKNTIYGFSPKFPELGERGRITYDDSTEPQMCILCTVAKSGQEVGYLFDNDEINGVRVYELLSQFIENNGNPRIFYTNFAQECRPVQVRKSTNGFCESWSLEETLYSIYYGTTVEEADTLGAERIRFDAGIRLQDVEVFDMTRRNLVSKAKFSAEFSRGTCYRRDDTIHIAFPNKKESIKALEDPFGDPPKGYDFVTHNEHELYRILCALGNAGSWHARGDGGLCIGISQKNKVQKISFAEIVNSYFNGLIDADRIVESIMENHKKMIESGIVYDHLTHDKRNNFRWALAPVTKSMNSQLRGRDRVKPPYFFWTVYDTVNGKYKLKLGIYGLWERRYYFDDLTYKNNEEDFFSASYSCRRAGDSLYTTIYAKFKEHIGSNNMKANLSYLSHWADPDTIADPENELIKMLREPIEMYKPALYGWLDDKEAFDDMPRL